MKARSCLFVPAALGVLLAAASASADIYVVTNTNNSGAGSFRQAIKDANSHAGDDTITFHIPGPGPHTIRPTSFLPAFTGRITVDGYSQPGASRATADTPATIMIELDGSSAGEDVGGLYFFTNSGNSRISGLAINNFNRVGVYLLNSPGTQIDGNYIGCDPTGTVAKGNVQSGIQIQQESSDGVIVGGTSVGERNVISGNDGDGVDVVNADDCVIKGNYVGTDATGTAALPNSGSGLDVYGDHAVIGGSTAVERNLISGNTENGINLDYAQQCNVLGNYIGTDKDGFSALANGGHGLDDTGDYNTIGGADPGEGNVISGNDQQGINLTESTHNSIIGNRLGTDVAGTTALPNHWSGICLASSSNDNTIGGGTPGERNLISGNDIYGVDIQSSTGVVVEGNYIGTNVDGGSALGNGFNGISISHGAHGITIGGASAGQGNLISGNTYVGVGIDDSHDNTVEGNYIGTDVTGTAALENGSGVDLGSGANDNSIGGPDPGQRNIISGNDYGVYLTGCSGNTIQGNYIGTAPAGTSAVPNTKTGIYFYQNGNDNTVGGTTENEGNLISGNAGYGVRIHQSSDNVLEGNYIGADQIGAFPLPNGSSGIYIEGNSDDNSIGGTAPGAGNIIAFNGKAGVAITSGTKNAVSSNSIFSNGGIGIDLGGDGVTPNDPDDPDTGPNRVQNFPDLTWVKVKPSGELQVAFDVSSVTPNSTYPFQVEFFKSDGGEGRYYVGFVAYTEPGTLQTIFLPGFPLNPGDPIVATATDSDDNTSEFSRAAVSPTGCMIHSGDYTGDGVSEIAVFRPSSGLWAVRGVTRVYFGGEGDLPVSGDYNGDGTADLGVFRGSTGLWAIRGMSRLYFGTAGDVPAPGDYNGDGSADPTVFQAGLWKIRGVSQVSYGAAGDQPVPGDYEGNGRREIAVFRPSSGLWAVRGVTREYFGREGDWPASGDYTGDGTWNVGIFRPTSGLWAVKGITRRYFGNSSDWPQPADYNGDLIDDPGIFRENTGLWAVKMITRVYFGAADDIPVAR